MERKSVVVPLLVVAVLVMLFLATNQVVTSQENTPTSTPMATATPMTEQGVTTSCSNGSYGTVYIKVDFQNLSDERVGFNYSDETHRFYASYGPLDPNIPVSVTYNTFMDEIPEGQVLFQPYSGNWSRDIPISYDRISCRLSTPTVTSTPTPQACGEASGYVFDEQGQLVSGQPIGLRKDLNQGYEDKTSYSVEGQYRISHIPEGIWWVVLLPRAGWESSPWYSTSHRVEIVCGLWENYNGLHFVVRRLITPSPTPTVTNTPTLTPKKTATRTATPTRPTAHSTRPVGTR